MPSFNFRAGTGIAAVAVALLALPGTSAVAQQEADTARNCVTVAAVRRTRVVDDRSILFYMRGGEVYYNQLSAVCHGLKRENRFTYDVSRGQLCAYSRIAVVQDMGGTWLPTSICTIGLFVPLGEDEAEDVLDAAEAANVRRPRRNRGRMEVEPVELPPEAAEGASESD